MVKHQLLVSLDFVLFHIDNFFHGAKIFHLTRK
jgi:hypothetical protein